MLLVAFIALFFTSNVVFFLLFAPYLIGVALRIMRSKNVRRRQYAPLVGLVAALVLMLVFVNFAGMGLGMMLAQYDPGLGAGLGLELGRLLVGVLIAAAALGYVVWERLDTHRLLLTEFTEAEFDPSRVDNERAQFRDRIA